jgi:hypothetical protein
MEAALRRALSLSAAPVAAARLRGAPTQPLSLFIVGPSRAGKTTLERITGRLDGVKRGHESRFIERAARRTSQQCGLLTTSDPNELPAALDARLGEIYLEEIQAFAPGAKIVTDTYPAMIPYFGRAATAIPNARFVFMKREPRDLALRIFMRHYKTGNHYGYDIKTIFEHISWYYKMMDIWLEKYPDITVQVGYEEMIADPRAIVRLIAGFCGVDATEGPLPDIGDDRGCSKPYQELIAAALAG